MRRTSRPLPPVADPYAELKKAHAEGKVIQWRGNDGDRWETFPCPIWSFPPERYRIKPITPLIALEAGDVLAGDEFMDKQGTRFAYCYINADGAAFQNSVCFLRTWEQLMNHGWKYRHIGGEWMPCSKPVKEAV